MKFRGTSNLKAPAWPVQQIIANKAAFEKAIALRNTNLYKNKQVGDVETLYNELAVLQRRRQEVATERNALAKLAKSRAIAANKKDKLDDGDLKTQAKKVKTTLAQIEHDISETETELAPLLDSIPNLIASDTAKVSLEAGFETVEKFGPEVVEAPPNKQRDHVDIGTRRGLLDLEAGARVSGTGFYFLVNEGAMLEQALVQYALSKCRDAGFNLVSPPTLVRQQFSEACGFRPRDETDVTQMYTIASQDDLCLVGTAEIPLAGQFAHRTVDELTKHAGVCRSYRAEAGARGADTRGLYRVHEFTKVEMFIWSPSTCVEDSQAALDWLVQVQRDIVSGLELPCRVIKLAANDLGAPAYQKFDIEAWMPGRGSWGEISSASNCTDFQSRRLHTKTSSGGYVHTLNGTALAVPRIILALIENNWDSATGQIALPAALQPYMGGRQYI